MEIYRKKLETIADCLRKLSEIRKENSTLEKYRNSWKDRDAAERNLQKTAEAIIDFGKMLIAERKLRSPGNNREVFLILEENALFPSEYIALMDKMIGMRNLIVHGYNRIDDAIVYAILRKNLGDIKKVKSCLERLLPQGKG